MQGNQKIADVIASLKEQGNNEVSELIFQETFLKI